MFYRTYHLSNAQPTLMDPSVVWRICHVMRRWREISISYPGLWQHINTIIPNVYGRLALIGAYALIVVLRLDLPKAESLPLEPITSAGGYSSTAIPHSFVRLFRTSCFPNLERFIVVANLWGNILIEGSSKLSSVHLRHSSIHPPPISTLRLIE